MALSLSVGFDNVMFRCCSPTQNGIEDLFAKTLYAQNITADIGTFRQLTASSTVSDETLTNKLCVSDVCVTRDQFLSMVAVANADRSPHQVRRMTTTRPPTRNQPRRNQRMQSTQLPLQLHRHRTNRQQINL